MTLVKFRCLFFFISSVNWPPLKLLPSPFICCAQSSTRVLYSVKKFVIFKPEFCVRRAWFVSMGQVNCFFRSCLNVTTVDPKAGKSKKETFSKVPLDMVKVIFKKTLLRGRPTWLLEKGFQENHLIMHGVGVPKHMRHYERIRQKRFCAMVVEKSLTSRKDWWDTYKRRGVNSGGHSF